MHLSVFGQLGHLERLDSIFYFLKASENQLTHSETKYFEQHKVEKILFICKMCLNLNCNRKVFENWVQPGSVMGVAWQSKWNVWKGSYSKANEAFAQWFVLCEHCLWLTQKLKQKIRSVTEVQKILLLLLFGKATKCRWDGESFVFDVNMKEFRQ